MGIRKQTMTSQITNAATYDSYFRQMTSLAQNVYPIEGLPDTVFLPYVNRKLLYSGSIAFYVEPEIGLIALPYQIIGRLDIYNRPIKIKCLSPNGLVSRTLNRDEYVIMYDNTDFRSLIPDIRLYAQKLALTARTADINISQQRTPRIIRGRQEQEQTIKNLYASVDRNEEVIYGYKDLDLDSIDTILTPAPYVADKLDEHADRIWNEFCRLIGISNIQQTKKERLLTSEVDALQAGAIASRFSRYTTRKTAVDEINEKFTAWLPEGEVKVAYYDTEPQSDVMNVEEAEEYEGGIEDELEK